MQFEDNIAIVSMKTGETLCQIDKTSKIIIRSNKQLLNDKLRFNDRCIIKGGFIKEMDKEQELFDKLKSKPALYVAYVALKKHLQPKTNFVTLDNGGRFKTTDLARELNISRQTSSNYIQELKKLNAIIEIETSLGWFYVINPHYATKSEDVPTSIVELFNVPMEAREQRKEKGNTRQKRKANTN